MSIDSKAVTEEGTPRYLAGGDAGLADYYPAWLDNIADDATVEGTLLDGAVRGPDGVRAIVTAIRAFYGDSQEFHFTGPWGESGWLEDYIARVDDKPLGCVVLITRNHDGQTQSVVASYRPVSTVIHFSRLLHERFADTPYAKHFLGGDRIPNGKEPR
jgi:hypothetical protein